VVLLRARKNGRELSSGLKPPYIFGLCGTTEVVPPPKEKVGLLGSIPQNCPGCPGRDDRDAKNGQKCAQERERKRKKNPHPQKLRGWGTRATTRGKNRRTAKKGCPTRALTNTCSGISPIPRYTRNTRHSRRYRRFCREGGDPVRYGLR